MTNHFEQLTAKVENLIHGGTDGHDAISFLKSQHREVEALFAKIEEGGSGSGRAKLLAELVHRIEGHAAIEEEVFYPAGKPVDKGLTLEAIEEHGMVKDMIAKLHEIGPSDESFMAKVTVLKELIEHHVKEEENSYFPEVRKSLGEERLVALGAELEQAFARFNRKPVAVKLPAKKAAATKRPAAKAHSAKSGSAKSAGSAGTKSRSAKVSPGTKPRAKAPGRTKAKSTGRRAAK